MIWKSIGNDRRGPTELLILLSLRLVRVMRNVDCSRLRLRGIQASTCKDFWLISITFLTVAAGKNLINC